MIQSEPVAGLLLDESNSRFRDPATGQDDAITSMLLLAWQKVLNLAADIVEEDAVNPTELPIAVVEDGGVVVIEGNRRLAALKLLRDPELARAASTELDRDLVAEFRRLKAIGAGPDAIDVFLAPSREEARHWIELRHTGEHNGVGVVQWEAWQANNYRRRRGSQADKATIFCSGVETAFPNEVELLANITKVRRTRLTTLGRLVGDPAVRRDFGFDFRDDELVFEYARADMLRGVRRIFSDLAGPNVSVTDIKKKAHRADYVTKRSEVLPPRDRKLPRAQRADSLPEALNGPGGDEAEASGDGGAPDEKPRTKQREPKPERVIFEGLKLPHVTAQVRSLLKQAQGVDINGSPQVAGILVRIIVELVVSDAIEEKAVPGKENDKLKKKIRNALLALDPECESPGKRDKKLTMAWTRTQDPDGMAIESLHAYVHNRYGAPTPGEVRELSATFRNMLERVDGLIAGKTT